MQLQWNFSQIWTSDYEMNEFCPKPCQFLSIRLSENTLSLTEESNIVFKFEQYLRVTTSTIAYGGLELLAELGGYVGLFLGISFLNFF